MKTVKYMPHGVCSRQIDVDFDGEQITRVVITGGCAGNSQGVARLVEGMTPVEAIKRLAGIDCKGRGTSCPDQLSKALSELL